MSFSDEMCCVVVTYNRTYNDLYRVVKFSSYRPALLHTPHSLCERNFSWCETSQSSLLVTQLTVRRCRCWHISCRAVWKLFSPLSLTVSIYLFCPSLQLVCALSSSSATLDSVKHSSPTLSVVAFSLLESQTFLKFNLF